MIATTILTLLFLVEVTQAHTWKGASMPLKVYAMVTGTIGLIAAIGVLIDRIRSRRAHATPMTQPLEEA